MEEPKQSAGDPIPPGCELIEIHVSGLRQLFNSIDPSPFHDRDLDPDAEEFIVGWAREAPRDAELALLVHLDRPAGLPDEPATLRNAISEQFARREKSTMQRLRQLLRIGRISLVIGLLFLAAAVLAGDLIARRMENSRVGELLRECLIIGGWVAMWRPLEIFLYGWWPVLAEARLYRRLSAMPVRIAYESSAEHAAWEHDWPAAPAPIRPARAAGAPSPSAIIGEPAQVLAADEARRGPGA